MPITGLGESSQSVLDRYDVQSGAVLDGLAAGARPRDHARLAGHVLGPPEAQRGWSAQRTLGAAFFFTFLAAQILVPGFLLLQPRPRKFGWQIYAYPVGLAEPAVGVELADGTEVAPQSYSHIKEWLPDLGYDRGLATYLCGITPESRAVVLTRTFPAHQLVRYPCP